MQKEIKPPTLLDSNIGAFIAPFFWSLQNNLLLKYLKWILVLSTMTFCCDLWISRQIVLFDRELTQTLYLPLTLSVQFLFRLYWSFWANHMAQASLTFSLSIEEFMQKQHLNSVWAVLLYLFLAIIMLMMLFVSPEILSVFAMIAEVINQHCEATVHYLVPRPL